MLARLIVGIIKGLVVGGLLGLGFLQLGFASFPLWVALLAAALSGIVIGLVAGKPIWAKDARIEAGMKATVGAILGAGLMFAAHRYLTMELPNGLLALLGVMTKGIALGHFPITALATVTALLGGFYEADNTPEPEGETKSEGEAKSAAASGGKKRIATSAQDEDIDDEFSEDADPKKAKK
jgi:hypothetical protein